MKTTDGGGHWADVAEDSNKFLFLLVDPASPATIYAIGGPYWFIYKSTDGGVSWALLAAANGLSPLIGALAIAPSLTTTLYAGSARMGILKSIDGGLSWVRVNNGLTGSGSPLAIDPTNADVVYAISGTTVVKTTNGGGQWRQLPISFPAGAYVHGFAIDPTTPSNVYAAYAVFDDNDALIESGIFKSIDSGETWFAAQNPGGRTVVSALAIDPTMPGRIYANTTTAVFMSTDGAASWTPINSYLPRPFVWGLSVDRTGSIRTASPVGLFEYRVAASPASGTMPVIEYYYAAFDHYFVTSNPDEISKLDSEGPTGWVRTGLQFNAYAPANEHSAPVCRFFSESFAPKSSHFYTAFATECFARIGDHAWTLETADAFDIGVPAADGSCAEGLMPVYRLYNSGHGGAPNHRYTTDLAVREQMIAQGWVPEGFGPNGVEMCSPP
jgi:photosystem II stability/assembly factor-like uncharacterized protein